MSIIKLAGPDMVDVFTSKVLVTAELKRIAAEKQRFRVLPRKCYLPMEANKFEAVWMLCIGIGNGRLVGLCRDGNNQETWRYLGAAATRARLNRPRIGEVIHGG